MFDKIEISPPDKSKKIRIHKKDTNKLKKQQRIYSQKDLPKKPKCRHAKNGKFKCNTLSSYDIYHFHRNFYKMLDKISQDNFILRNLTISSVKRKRPRNNSRRSNSFSCRYNVTSYKYKQRIPVCLSALCGILCVKPGRIKGIARRFASTGENASEKHGGNRKELAFRAKKELVQNFIKKFRPLESHYSRDRIKQRIYLDPSLNILKMYRMYDEQALSGYSVSKVFFRKIFNKYFNIGFGSPRQDVCSSCSQLLEKLKIETNEQEKQKYRSEYRIHVLRAKCFFTYLQEDNPDILILSFDCQKNLPLPKVADQSAYYSRQLYIYNFTIVIGNSHSSLASENVHSYVWTEDMGPKGSNEITSALFHCLNRINTNRKKCIRLVADGCVAQNKNSILIGMVSKWFLSAPENIEKVEVIFPVTGHSFIPPDRAFALTEKQIRREETILDPEQYISIMSLHATVHRLVTTVPVFDWKSICKDVLKSTQTWHFQISKVKRIIIEKKLQRVYVRGELSYKKDADQRKPINKRGKTINQIMPVILNSNFKVKENKLIDVDQLLQKHFGASWRTNPDLKYYANVILSDFNENLRLSETESIYEDLPYEEIFNSV